LLQFRRNTASVFKESCLGQEEVAHFGGHLQNLCTVCVPILCTLSPRKSINMSYKGDLLLNGSGGRDRTYDQLINSQLLYR
jgi:hypothetical protein